MQTFKEYYEEWDEDYQQKPIAPVVYIGTQEFGPSHPDIELFNPSKPIKGLIMGSTYSRQTIESKGYYIPPIPKGTPRDTPVSSLVRKSLATEAQTKENPFNYYRPSKITPKKTRLPRKVFKPKLKAKLQKRDIIKPRNWHLNSLGKLVKMF